MWFFCAITESNMCALEHLPQKKKKKKKEQKQKGNEVPYIPVVQPVVQPWFALKPKESG